MSRLDQELTRFLFLVPYVAQHEDGVPTAELCEQLSCTPSELRRLVERVALVGTPDGAPDELVEIYLEGDRVFVALPQRFTRPPRFTVQEMLALLLALAPLRDAPLPSLQQQAEELSQRLVGLASERATEVAPALLDRVVIHADGAEQPAHLRDLEVAVRDRTWVDAVYYTAGRDQLTTRRLAPIGLLQVRGAWYVVAADEAKRGPTATKTFKVERFRSLALSDATFDAFEVDLGLIRRRLEARDLQGAKSEDVRVELDGRERTFPTGSTHTMRRWIRSLRGRGVILGPSSVREEMRRELRSLVERYADADGRSRESVSQDQATEQDDA